MSRGDYCRRPLGGHKGKNFQRQYFGKGKNKKARDITMEELRKREYNGPSLKDLSDLFEDIAMAYGDMVMAYGLFSRRKNIEKKLKNG